MEVYITMPTHKSSCFNSQQEHTRAHNIPSQSQKATLLFGMPYKAGSCSTPPLRNADTFPRTQQTQLEHIGALSCSWYTVRPWRSSTGPPFGMYWNNKALTLLGLRRAGPMHAHLAPPLTGRVNVVSTPTNHARWSPVCQRQNITCIGTIHTIHPNNMAPIHTAKPT